MKILFVALIIFSFSLQAKTLQVMSYNVENLFDAKHDSGKKDWSFLPKDYPGKKEACKGEKNRHYRKECFAADWTEAKVDLKISQINDVVTKERPLPDFLGLVEVENPNVVGRLAKKLGYENFEMTESPDERGVDVALLYKTDKDIKKMSRTEHVVPVDHATRNILEVEFLINGKYPLTIFVNHWPSLANPDSWRVKAAEILANRAQELMKKNPKMAILAMGDFNTVDDNNPHPFKTVLYKDNFFTDIESAFLEDKNIDEKIKKSKPPGTYYFPPKDVWNSLDHFFANKVLMDGKDLDLNLKSFEIYSPSFITFELKKKVYVGDQKNVKIVIAPKLFDPDGTTKETIGYSDHFPILLKLDYPEAPVTKKKNKNKKKMN
ncbi:MAG: endonuclease/exonuclease/phosphatase family protein [Bacteriovorax sp.]